MMCRIYWYLFSIFILLYSSVRPTDLLIQTAGDITLTIDITFIDCYTTLFVLKCFLHCDVYCTSFSNSVHPWYSLVSDVLGVPQQLYLASLCHHLSNALPGNSSKHATFQPQPYKIRRFLELFSSSWYRIRAWYLFELSWSYEYVAHGIVVNPDVVSKPISRSH